MATRVELIFDIVSPNAYLIWWPLRELVKRHEAELDVTPVFLAGMHKLTGNAPPFIRDAEVKGKTAYAMLEMQRFIAKHGLTKWKMNPKFPFNSISLQRLLVAVGNEDRIRLIDTLLPPIWEEKMDVADLDAVGTVVQSAGFDAQQLFAQTQDPDVKQKLVNNTENAVERGAFGIPTFFVDGEMFFGKERLGQIEEEISA